MKFLKYRRIKVRTFWDSLEYKWILQISFITRMQHNILFLTECLCFYRGFHMFLCTENPTAYYSLYNFSELKNNINKPERKTELNIYSVLQWEPIYMLWIHKLFHILLLFLCVFMEYLFWYFLHSLFTPSFFFATAVALKRFLLMI